MKPEYRPTNKVSIGVLAGSIVFIAAWVVEELSGVQLPTQVVIAAQTVGVFIAQWATSDEVSPKG